MVKKVAIQDWNNVVDTYVVSFELTYTIERYIYKFVYSHNITDFVLPSVDCSS